MLVTKAHNFCNDRVLVGITQTICGAHYIFFTNAYSFFTMVTMSVITHAHTFGDRHICWPQKLKGFKQAYSF